MIAIFSPYRQYRYTLWRNWNCGLFTPSGKPRSYVNFICLNPSTADELKDDNTICKCVKFAKSWGYDALCVTNLFAWRSTDKSVLKRVSDPIGPENDYYLENVAVNADLVIAAWSQDGSLFNRSNTVLKHLNVPMSYLRMGKTEPWHPLYLPDNTTPTRWAGSYNPNGKRMEEQCQQ